MRDLVLTQLVGLLIVLFLAFLPWFFGVPKPKKADPAQLLQRATTENDKWLSGDPLAMYGQYPPDPMFRPKKIAPDPAYVSKPTPWEEKTVPLGSGHMKVKICKPVTSTAEIVGVVGHDPWVEWANAPQWLPAAWPEH